MSRADWSRLSAYLRGRPEAAVTLTWGELDDIVGGLPASATDHYPQWWHGDRPNTRAWRAAGFELDRVDVGRTVTFRRPAAPSTATVPSASTIAVTVRTPQRQRVDPTPAASALADVNPRRTLIILQCSARKAAGGTVTERGVLPAWPAPLMRARATLAATARVDERRVLPAWQRYTGTFYTTAAPALRDAVRAGANVVIVSGGYGLVRAEEPIGYYEKVLRLADWPRQVLENALLEHVRTTQPETVIAFVSATTDYARLMRRTPWSQAAGVPVLLVTVTLQGGGAMVKVPRALGHAFAAFWARMPRGLPEGATVERLA